MNLFTNSNQLHCTRTTST